MLTSRLPVAFSFDKLRAPILQKKRKHDDTDATTPKLAQLRDQVVQVTSKLDRAIEILNTLTQQQQKMQAALMQNGNEDWLDATNNPALPESATSPATTDEMS